MNLGLFTLEIARFGVGSGLSSVLFLAQGVWKNPVVLDIEEGKCLNEV